MKYLGDKKIDEVRKFADDRKKALEDFETQNDVVCYHMKLGQED